MSEWVGQEIHLDKKLMTPQLDDFLVEVVQLSAIRAAMQDVDRTEVEMEEATALNVDSDEGILTYVMESNQPLLHAIAALS